MGMMEDIIRHEGTIPYQRHIGTYRDGLFYPYKDTKGKLTIGYGSNIDKAVPRFFDVGIDEREAMMMAESDLKEAGRNARYFAGKGWKKLSPSQQEVITEMAYQLGLPKLLEFEKMQKATEKNDLKGMVREMLDSKWAKKDSPSRATELANKMYRK